MTPGSALASSILHPLSSLFAVVLLTAGCQKVLPPNNTPVVLMEDERPLAIDEATQARDWERSTLYYPNGAVEAGSTRFLFAPKPTAGPVGQALLEPVLFVVNTAVLPFTYVTKPPFSPYDYPGAVTEASYTVQPAYPPESATPVTEAATDADVTPAGQAGPVPDPQSPVPSPSEPVREITGEQPPLPTENQGATERPGAPADAAPQPVAPPAGGAGGE